MARYRKRSAGEPLAPSAADWHAIQRATRDADRGGSSWSRTMAAAVVARNEYGRDLEAWEVVGLKESILDGNDAGTWSPEYRDRRAFKLSPVYRDDAYRWRVGVTIEPIADGQFGQVVVAGVTPAALLPQAFLGDRWRFVRSHSADSPTPIAGYDVDDATRWFDVGSSGSPLLVDTLATMSWAGQPGQTAIGLVNLHGVAPAERFIGARGKTVVAGGGIDRTIEVFATLDGFIPPDDEINDDGSGWLDILSATRARVVAGGWFDVDLYITLRDVDNVSADDVAFSLHSELLDAAGIGRPYGTAHGAFTGLGYGTQSAGVMLTVCRRFAAFLPDGFEFGLTFRQEAGGGTWTLEDVGLSCVLL